MFLTFFRLPIPAILRAFHRDFARLASATRHLGRHCDLGCRCVILKISATNRQASRQRSRRCANTWF